MRFVGIALVLLISACASANTAGLSSPEPTGNLAQLMRGILFPNSNILFDVQSVDPADPPPAASGAGATATFSGIYTGWQVVENAAIALRESATLMSIPGRRCENGQPVPLTQANWIQFTQQLREAADVMLVAARAENQDAASDATNDVAEACYVCHEVYRDTEPRCTV
ncbi:MAG: cytochrome c [Gemmatimonadota bacterium]|nr:cytochrome c [Gemmatimonadota bacterium]MDH3423846.1 cytochrome c [Gemmatimonadota bacterium]